MRLIIAFLLICTVTSNAVAQRGDSILANERTLDRPLTLHKGQIRITGGYAFALYSRRYDGKGKSVELSSDGDTRSQQLYSAGLSYGITNILQLAVNASYKSQLERSRDVTIFTNDEVLQVHELTQTTGMEDVYIALDARAPGLPRKFDLVLSVGSTLPVGKTGSRKPRHTLQSFDDWMLLSYKYNNRWGTGVPIVVGALRGKYRSEDWGVTLGGEYRLPMDESKSTGWIHRLEGNKFEYRSYKYSLQHQSQLLFSGEFEYQLFPWVNLFMMAEWSQWSGGWSMQSGAKTAFAESYLMSVRPGIEILVTSRLWLRQRMALSVAGQEQFAPFSFHTTISYNYLH